MKRLSAWGWPPVAFAIVAAGLLVGGILIRRAEGQDSPAASNSPATQGGDQRPKRLKPEDFRLIGGWRVAQPFTRGGLAIDFKGRRVFIGGPGNQNEFVEFSMSRKSPVGRSAPGSSTIWRRRGNSRSPARI